jgi:hypothetical protein
MIVHKDLFRIREAMQKFLKLSSQFEAIESGNHAKVHHGTRNDGHEK